MSMEPTQRYDILFAGECLQGYDLQEVRVAVGKLFAADDATVARLFSGKFQRIKRNCDVATAQTYRDAMQRAGARVHIRPASDGEGDALSDRPASAVRAGLGLAPAGTEVLTAKERVAPAAPQVATAHLSVAAPHDRLSEPTDPPVGPDAKTDFELAPLGSRIGDESRPAAAAEPDTSGIALVAGELDLSDCAPPTAPPPALDFDDLRLLDPDTDNHDATGLSPRHPDVPDTQHLSLEPIDEPSA